MLPIKWRRKAILDLQRIAEHIAADSPRAAGKLVDKIVAKIESLRDRPILYRTGRAPGTREMVVHPNYVVVYRLNAEAVEIIRIKHTAQKWPEH